MAKSIKAKTMLLYGRISILERLKADPESMKKIFLQENISLADIEELANKNEVPSERMRSNELQRMKPAKDLQGVIARVDKFEYASFDNLLSKAHDKKISLVFLDRINDPHNLGAIVRTLSCFGGFAVVIPQFNACGVTEAVLHVASGGENYVPVSVVPNLSASIIKAKKHGFWITGAEAGEDSSDINSTSFAFPLGLVLGSEGGGIRYGVGKHLDFKVKIPMKGAALSFNVGIACAIFCYEISRQRKEMS